MNTGDREITRQILICCKSDFVDLFTIGDKLSMERHEIRERSYHIVKNGLAEERRESLHERSIRATEKAKYWLVAPYEVPIDSMKVIEVVSDRCMTTSEIWEELGEQKRRKTISTWLTSLSGRGYLSCFKKECGGSNYYQLTEKGGRLLTEITGHEYRGPKIVSSIFNLGKFLT